MIGIDMYRSGEPQVALTRVAKKQNKEIEKLLQTWVKYYYLYILLIYATLLHVRHISRNFPYKFR